jgi:hypothetical protein
LRRTCRTIKLSLQDRIQDKLSLIKAPTLVVRGEKDAVDAPVMGVKKRWSCSRTESCKSFRMQATRQIIQCRRNSRRIPFRVFNEVIKVGRDNSPSVEIMPTEKIPNFTWLNPIDCSFQQDSLLVACCIVNKSNLSTVSGTSIGNVRPGHAKTFSIWRYLK